MVSSVYFQHCGAIRRTFPFPSHSGTCKDAHAHRTPLIEHPRAAPVSRSTHSLSGSCALAGKCAANSRSDELNLEAPADLLNLDVLHKRSTSRNVDAMAHGRFSSAPREFSGDKAISRSNYSLGSRVFLDPYHVADGNLWAENFLQNRFQRGGMTSLAGRSKQLTFEPERFGKEDAQSRARSRYVEPEGGRFIPALKPACARDKGPDPYGTYKHMTWTKANTGFTGGMGSVSKMAPTWSTFSLSRPAVGQ